MNGLLDRLAKFPQAPLGHTQPTPLERADHLSGDLGIDLWLKRDDVSGLGMGGNKVRQLSFYFGEAMAEGADAILITGAVQSNFMRTAAAAGAKLGLSVHLQLEERVPSNDPLYQTGGNVFLDDLFGAERRSYPAGEDEAGADRALAAWADELRAAGKNPTSSPSDLATGRSARWAIARPLLSIWPNSRAIPCTWPLPAAARPMAACCLACARWGARTRCSAFV
jgi:1-aminocyclopropane-1-carboxylate deaminase/D-cysteine desulfhydrase-like pyridoxal-dependent ACC family enzyme